MTDVDALVRLLIEHSGTPIEMASATAIFEAICGEALTIEVFTLATRCLTAQEYQLLTPSDAPIGHERRGSCSKPGTLQPEVTLAAKNRSSTWPFGCGVPPRPSGLVRQRATRCSAGAEFFTRAPGEPERAARRRT